MPNFYDLRVTLFGYPLEIVKMGVGNVLGCKAFSNSHNIQGSAPNAPALLACASVKDHSQGERHRSSFPSK